MLKVSQQELSHSQINLQVSKPNRIIKSTFKSIKKGSMLLIDTPNPQPTQWTDLFAIFSSQFFDPNQRPSALNQNNSEVYLYEVHFEINVDGQNSFIHQCMLFKAKKQLEELEKMLESEYGKVQDKSMSELIKNIFQKQIKGKIEQILSEFLQISIPQNLTHIGIITQTPIKLLQQQTCTNFIVNTLCYPCKKSRHFTLTLTNQCILITRKQNQSKFRIQQCIPLTKNLIVNYSLPKQKSKGHHHTVEIQSGKTNFQIAFEKFHDLAKFMLGFQMVKKRSRYFEGNLFNSFAVEREMNAAKFYSDGKGYFMDLFDQIEKAKTKICITGWMISPYFLLKRPGNIEQDDSRLDFTLQRAANRGVKIYVLVFQEPSLFVSNDSFHVKDHFESLHKNIKVFRHPGIIIPQLWSHHEKSVIIDEKVAFMGGLDICFGRWDIPEHSMVDKQNYWSGADYKNEKLRENQKPRDYKVSNLDRSFEPRMPWHDIAIKVVGPSVNDIQRHFVQYWYFALRDLSDDPRDHFLDLVQRYQQIQKKKISKQFAKNKDKTTQNLFNLALAEIILKTITKPSQQQEYQLTVTWKKNTIEHPASDDLRFGERIESAMKSFKDLINNDSKSTYKTLVLQGISANVKSEGKLKLQLCRSSCQWSTGIKIKENSILQAYINLIQNSKNFIYIENQFFMSVQNPIAGLLVERIIKAFDKKESFKVIVMMPLMPGFQGNVADEKSSVLRAQMNHQYQTIKRGENSIYQKLSKIPNLNISDYIYFFGVRAHGLLSQSATNSIKVPKTQIIYIHSKLMIVDDHRMIIGSANINDRSLKGNRDSQLAMVVTDPSGKPGIGQIFRFRCEVFGEHFGMDEEKCKDVNGDWGRLVKVAKKNTRIYRELFGCIPDDNVKSVSQIKDWVKTPAVADYQKLKKQLTGHYVEFPLDFLCEEDLSIKSNQVESLMPMISFT